MTSLCTNIKLKTSKTIKYSPKTFLKNYVYDDPPPKGKKRRKKISMEDFEIPSFKEFDMIVTKNFNVNQLKSICRYYKQRVSGNKPELIKLLWNYLKYSNYALKIQKCFRGYIVRVNNKLRGPGIIINKCVNETDFLTMENLKDLDKSQFYSFKDKDGFIYGFDICSLYNLIVKEKQDRNPYNRNKMPITKIYEDIKHILKLSKIFNKKINIKLNNDISQFSQEKQIEMRAINIFQNIDTYGFITDAKWYLNLNRHTLKKFVGELLDIWRYRAQISNETKRKINPQHGDPFFTVNMNVLLHKCYEVLRKRILDIIEIFITQGEDVDSKSLGTYYVLGALTTVSHEAATALPWLYESFVQNQQ
jgi:hypothetical protein